MLCSCCGGMIMDQVKDNVSHGKVPYPHDTGFGMCKDCGGDPDSDDFKKQMGRSMQTFCEARFKILRGKLSAKNQASWDTMPYWKKVGVIIMAVKDGMMI